MIRNCTLKDIDTITEILSDIFINHEPMCKCLNITREEFIYSFKNVITECIKTNLSILVENNNEICAVSLVIPYNIYENLDINISDNIKPLIDCLHDLNNIQLNEKKEDILYLFIIGTDSKHMNNGYSSKLFERILHNVSSKYKYIMADATNIISQHLCYKYGFRKISKIDYKDNQYFNRITTTQSVIRMLKTI